MALAHSQNLDYKDMPVIFEDVEILAPTLLQSNDQTFLCVSILPSTRAFEVSHEGQIKASGKVRSVKDNEEVLFSVPTEVFDKMKDMEMSSKDVYKEFKLQGYEYTGDFQGIVAASLGGHEGVLKWIGNWSTFLDTIAQIGLLSGANGAYRLPRRLRNLRIDPRIQTKCLESYGDHPSCVRLYRNDELKITQAGGVQIIGLEISVSPRIVKQKPAVLEAYEFIPYEQVIAAEVPDYLQCCSTAARQTMQQNPDIKTHTLPLDLLQQLADLPAGVVSMSYEDPQAYPLLAALKQATNSNTSNAFVNDRLLTAVPSVRYGKPAFDIVFESFRIHKILLTEIVDSQAPSLYTVVLAAVDNVSNVMFDYTIWMDPAHDHKLYDSDRVTINQSEQNLGNLSSANQHLMVCSHVTKNSEKVVLAQKMLRANGFLLTLDYTHHNREVKRLLSDDFDLLYKVEDPLQTLTLWRLTGNSSGVEDEVMEIAGFKTEWLEPLKEKLEQMNSSREEKRLWLVSNERNGTIGLANSLRAETSDDVIRCMFNAGDGKLPDFKSEGCVKQRKKNLVMNVYRNGTWGAYRHIPLVVNDRVVTLHADVNIYPPGNDLSNLRWIKSSVKHDTSGTTSEVCNVSCVTINLNDMLLVGGKLQADVLGNNCMLGQEFSGYTQNNKRRVMGLCKGGALATAVKVDKECLWDVPADWSMREAASVPLVYSLAYYALIVRGRLLPKEKVLIHSAASAVGLASVRIALSMECQVITTVDDEARKRLLTKLFFEIKARDILDSQSPSFEFEIKVLTKGKGVDVVLNSLAEEKLLPSINVLASHGRLLQIGRAVMDNNTTLGISCLLKDISIQGVTIDSLLSPGNKEWGKVEGLVISGIHSAVLNLSATLSLGKMRSGKHFNTCPAERI